MQNQYPTGHLVLKATVMSGKSGWPIFRDIVTDFSFALINASLLVFNYRFKYLLATNFQLFE